MVGGDDLLCGGGVKHVVQGMVGWQVFGRESSVRMEGGPTRSRVIMHGRGIEER